MEQLPRDVAGEVGLVLEVAVDGAGRQPALGDDLRDRGVGPLPGQDLERGLGDLLASGGAMCITHAGHGKKNNRSVLFRRFAISRSPVSSVPSRLRTVGAGTVVLGLTWALTSCSGAQPAAPAFDTVSLGTVSTGVTASGALAAKTSEQLGFAQGGKLTSVNVKVGQKVQAGDVLATVDSKAARAALRQAEANAEAQAAGLGKASDDPSVQGAASTLAQARHVVLESKQQAAATQDADNTAISRAKKQKSTDENAKNDADDAVDDAQNACDDAKDNARRAAAVAAHAAAAGPPTPAAATVAASAASSAASTATSACGGVGGAEAGVTA